MLHQRIFLYQSFGFGLTFTAVARDRWIGVEIYVSDDPDKLIFDHFHAQKDVIEQEFGDSLEWEPLKDRKGCRIASRRRQVDPMDRTRWPGYFDWYLDRADRFRRVFTKRVRRLDLGALAADASSALEPETG